MQPEDPELTVIRVPPETTGRETTGRFDDDTIVRPRRSVPAAAMRPAADGRFALVEPAESWGSAATSARVPAAQSPERFRRVRVNSRESFSLETPLIIGRKPTAPRIAGGVGAQLVAVPAALQEVSASHIEVRQQGSRVVVTDLNSTNGTRVAIPGSPPLTLRQGESVVVSVGSVVDIGDGNLIEVLPLQHVSNQNLP